MLDSGLDAGNISLSVSAISKEHRSFIRGIIHRRIKDRYQADDVFQNVFLTFFLKPLPADMDNIKGHVYRTTSNCITSYQRQMVCYQQHLNRCSKSTSVVEVQSDPQEMLIVIEKTKNIFSLICNQLSKKEGRAITLRYLNDFDFNEIALEMHVKAETAEGYLTRALTKLRTPAIRETICAAIGYDFGLNLKDTSLASA